MGLAIPAIMFDQGVSSFGALPEEEGQRQILGGKTIVILGYDGETDRWLFLSPWPDWGIGGLGWMPAGGLDLEASGPVWSIDASLEPLDPPTPIGEEPAKRSGDKRPHRRTPTVAAG